MRIEPLRNLVLVRYVPAPPKSTHLVVMGNGQSVRRAVVVAIGPECREVAPQQTVLVQSAAATHVGDEALVPEYAILGVL